MFSVPPSVRRPVSLVRFVPRLATLATVAAAACVYDARVPSEPTAARTPAFAVQASNRGGPGQNGRHIVSFRGQIPSDFAAQVARLGGQVLWTSSGTRLAVVRGLSSASAASLAGNQSVEEVDQDDLLQLEKPTLSAVDAGGAVGPQSADNPAGAVRFARQWNMRAVGADAAGAGGFLGSPDVSIFMLDSGIDYLHADLVGRVDLDRSTDLLGTFDVPVVVGNDTVIVAFTEADTVAQYFPDRLPITDLFFHGTHTGATVSSNAVRTAGVTSKTKLVAVKVCGYIDLCPFSSILAGVLYGAANGADVMNLSLAGAFLKKGNTALIQERARVFEFDQRPARKSSCAPRFPSSSSERKVPVCQPRMSRVPPPCWCRSSAGIRTRSKSASTSRRTRSVVYRFGGFTATAV